MAMYRRREFLGLVALPLAAPVMGATQGASFSAPVVRRLFWTCIPTDGCERAEVQTDPAGVVLRGTILRASDRGPAEAHYEILCGPDWNTLAATVSCEDDAGKRSLTLRRNGRAWVIGGQVNPRLDDASDVDLGWSPITNTLPIRRLRLPTGARSDVLTMAWIRFPELTVQPLAQVYERLSDSSYRYSSGGGNFTAVITVDEQGFVVEYEKQWRRSERAG
jgi:hypothetical protein